MNKIAARGLVLALGTTIITTGLSASANAASKNQFCKQYARTATSLYHQAKAAECGFSGAYWHSAKGLHKLWCMNVPRDEANAGHAYRVNKLNRCEGVEEGD